MPAPKAGIPELGQPARVAGGDYYDAIRVGESSIAIAIGDGKGMAAALLMSNLYRRLCVPLPRADYRLIAARVAPGKYITFFYAGHNPPLLQHRDGTLEALCEGGSAELPEADRGGGFPLRRKPCWL